MYFIIMLYDYVSSKNGMITKQLKNILMTSFWISFYSSDVQITDNWQGIITNKPDTCDNMYYNILCFERTTIYKHLKMQTVQLQLITEHIWTLRCLWTPCNKLCSV